MNKSFRKTPSPSETAVAQTVRGRRAPVRLAGFAALLCGVFGLLLSAEKLFDLLRFRWLPVAATVVLASVLCWAAEHLPRFRTISSFAVPILGSLGFYLVFRKELVRRIQMLIRLQMQDPYELPAHDMTLVLCLAALWLVYLLYLDAFHLHVSWVFLPLTLGVPLFAASFGRTPPAYAILLLLVFHILALADNRADRNGGLASGGLLLLLLLGGASLFAVLLLTPHLETVYRLPRAVQQSLFPENTDPDDPHRSSGVWSTRYVSGAETLRVRTESMPAVAVYLRNFTGESYANGAWSAANEKGFFADLESEGISEPQTRFANRAYAGFRSLHARSETLTVERLAGAKSNAYRPYGGEISETNGNTDMFRWFPMWYTWADGANRDWADAGQTEYNIFVRERYTDVPEGLDRLEAVVQNNPCSNADDAVEFITRYLAETVEYTTMPGLTPPGAEPTEYAVFDNRRGFCVHFASAAALMLRMYGYPARFVTGYAAFPSLFVRGGRTYTATLTDEQAHAWVELYTSDAGWVPVEATPPNVLLTANSMPQNHTRSAEEALQAAGGGSAAPSFAPEPTAQPDTQTEAPARPAETARPAQKEKPSGTESTEPKAPFNGLPPAFWIAVCALIGIAALLVAAEHALRKRAARRPHDGPQKLLLETMRVLHFGGLLRDMDGTERALPKLLAETLGVSEDAAAALQADALAEAFGPPDAPPPRREHGEIYRQAAKTVQTHLRLLRRFLGHLHAYW